MARRPGRPKLNTKEKRTDFSTKVSVESKKYIDKQQKIHDMRSLGTTLDMLLKRLQELDNIS